MNYKLQQIMAMRNRARSNDEEEGMASLLARIKDIRTQATKAQPENPQKEID